jgi:hypothetical protein
MAHILSVSQSDKENWLRLAAGWLDLAEHAEKRRPQLWASHLGFEQGNESDRGLDLHDVPHARLGFEPMV